MKPYRIHFSIHLAFSIVWLVTGIGFLFQAIDAHKIETIKLSRAGFYPETNVDIIVGNYSINNAVNVLVTVNNSNTDRLEESLHQTAHLNFRLSIISLILCLIGLAAQVSAYLHENLKHYRGRQHSDSPASTTKINGKLIDGHGRASQCIDLQKPFLKKHLPEIESLHSGTINIRLEQALAIEKYDIETEPIEWTKGRVEKFYFTRAKIEFPNSHIKGLLPCVIYNSTTSAYRNHPFIVEVVMEKIDKAGISFCRLVFDQPCRTASWVILGSL